jgi:hypothetical protein
VCARPRARHGSGFPENAEGSVIRRRSQENANDREPDPGTTLHNMIVEGLSMPAALKETLFHQWYEAEWKKRLAGKSE